MAIPPGRSESSFLTPAIDEYMRGLFVHETPGMHDSIAALEAAGMPDIRVDATDGRILEVLLRMVGARRVVELGTLAAYSAQWIARALPADGHLWTIEASSRHAEVSRGVIERAGLSDRVTVLEGQGMQVLPKLEREGPFDAVFVDADKANYVRYAEWAARNLRQGGLLIGDNTYLFGWLVGAEPENEEERTMRAGVLGFHEVVAREFEGVCLPTIEGLTVGVKR